MYHVSCVMCHVSMCHVSISQKWTQTDTKVTFHPDHPPTIKLVLSQMKGYAKKTIFYSGTIALI